MFNNFYYNFEKQDNVTSYTFEYGSYNRKDMSTAEVRLGIGQYFILNLAQGTNISYETYVRSNFLAFFGSFSSIALGSVSIAAFLSTFHVDFKMTSYMLRHLYWKKEGY